MKFLIPLAIAAFLFALDSIVSAQTGPVSGGTGGVTTQPVISGANTYSDHAASLPTTGSGGTMTGFGTSSKTAGATAPETTSEETSTDESDDTLYHGRTSETGAPLLRDDGPLHFKTRPKEKVQEVSSTKHLQTTAADKAFEANLLHSSVTSIEDVLPKKDEADAESDGGDPRFTKKQLKFVPEQSDKSQKAEPDSSPSPTPTATASAKDQKSGTEN